MSTAATLARSRNRRRDDGSLRLSPIPGDCQRRRWQARYPKSVSGSRTNAESSRPSQGLKEKTVEVSFMRQALWVIWPAFLVAAGAETVFFAVFDPFDLHCVGTPLEVSR